MDILTLAMAKAYSDRKGGYTKTSAPVVVIPKGSYEFNNGECNTPTTQFPKEGDSITLTLDGAVYTETAKKGVVDGLEVLCIGNGASFGGDDTGENYSVVFVPSEGFVLVTDMDKLGGGSTATNTVELSFKTQTIVPIDQKYLPGVCLPVVDMTGCVLGEAITDETVITALNKCYAESPVIIGSIMTEGVTHLVFNKFVGMGFVASLMGGSISLVVSDGNWTLSFE